jgi:sulfur-oxidizing protein SoxY
MAPNGAKVPIVVEVSHPMEPDHYIKRLEVVNERDPIPLKGTFDFSPVNGQAFLAFQARMDEGASEVVVTAECTRHGRWSSRQPLTVADGTGGCASAPLPRTAGADIRPPRIHIPQLVREGRIRRDELIDVQLAIRHPNRTGLAFRDGRFIQQAEPFFLQSVEMFYGAERVSRFTMTPAISDDPFITFRFRPGREDLLKVVFTNSRGQRFEATHSVRLS